MMTKHADYYSIDSALPISYDPVTRQGEIDFYCNAQYSRDEIKQDINAFLLAEYAAHAIVMYDRGRRVVSGGEERLAVLVEYYSVAPHER